MLISAVQYAELHGKTRAHISHMCSSGKLKTAQRIGRIWVVDDNEPYPSISPNDKRIKSGAYVGFRKKQSH